MDKAYVTMLCNGDGYVTGAEVLGKSLVASGSKVPRLAMVTSDISPRGRAGLEAQDWELRDVEPIANPTSGALLAFSRFAMVYTKLRAWELTDVTRLVLLDADTLVLKNVDDLFDRPGFAAAPDFFLPDRFNSGREPERLDAEPVQVVELAEDAAQVSDPVSVRVGERARIDLIRGRALPPGGIELDGHRSRRGT
jgi:alpha-N-acetylglucosamine transferase